MPVSIARHAGFCMGVRRAMDTALEVARIAQKAGVPCCTLGEVIHNRAATQQLATLGVRVASKPEDVPGGVVIVRSHGVTPQVLRELEARGLQVADCTCPHVSRMHDRVAEYSSGGKPVIIVGEAFHPEVQGTSGWCQGPVYHVSTEREAALLPMLDQALAVAQTTFAEKRWQTIKALLAERVRSLETFESICPATSVRQREAAEMAAGCDAMIIVGGRNSANTRKLRDTCEALCPRTILVESAADIPPRFADIHKDTIGIAAGASTPDWLLKEVVTRMNDIEQVVQETEPQETLKPEAAADEGTRKDSFMADVEKTLVRIRPGQTVTGTVVQITSDEVCVNIGYKSDGLIPIADMVDEDVKLGDEIEVEVVKVNDGEGNVRLSQRNIVNRKAWDALMVKYEAGEYVEGVGKEAVKGGLLCDVGGVRTFVPASLLAQRYVDKIAQFVGQTMKLKIIEVDKAKKRIVADRKTVLVEETAARKAAAWEKITEGENVTGTVRRFADFGAFVDLGGVDGLIHVTDMAWFRVGHPSDILKIGQSVTCVVLSVDRERERIQLGYKQLQARPWDNIAEKYPVGVVLERKVVRIRQFGAFVELEPGVDGLVHISQCAAARVTKVEDVLTVGQDVRVKVLGIDPEAKRISLSIKEVLVDEADTGLDVDILGDSLTDDAQTEAPAEAPAETPAE